MTAREERLRKELDRIASEWDLGPRPVRRWKHPAKEPIDDEGTQLILEKLGEFDGEPRGEI